MKHALLLPLSLVSLVGVACTTEFQVLASTPSGSGALPDAAGTSTDAADGARPSVVPANTYACGWEKTFFKPLAGGACTAASGKCLVRYDGWGSPVEVRPYVGPTDAGMDVRVHAVDEAHVVVGYRSEDNAGNAHVGFVVYPAVGAGAPKSIAPNLGNTERTPAIALQNQFAFLETGEANKTRYDIYGIDPLAGALTGPAGVPYEDIGLGVATLSVQGSWVVLAGDYTARGVSFPMAAQAQSVVLASDADPIAALARTSNGAEVYYLSVPKSGGSYTLKRGNPLVTTPPQSVATFPQASIASGDVVLGYRANSQAALLLEKGALKEVSAGGAIQTRYTYPRTLGADAVAGTPGGALTALTVDSVGDVARFLQPCAYDAVSKSYSYGTVVLPLGGGAAPSFAWERAGFPLQDAQPSSLSPVPHNTLGAYRIVDAT